jgi:hypothetical protein
MDFGGVVGMETPQKTLIWRRTKAVLQRTGLGPRVPRPLPKSNKPQPAQIFFFFCVFFLLPAEEGSIRATHTNSL